MKVKELIEILENQDENYNVFIKIYEPYDYCEDIFKPLENNNIKVSKMFRELTIQVGEV